MDVATVTQLIGSVGFPIVCCIYLITTLQAEMKEMRKTIENNTQVMVRICAKLDLEEGSE